MGKLYKKMLSLMMVVIICVINSINIFAYSERIEEDIQNISLEKEHDFEFENDEVWETFDEIDGVRYYFKDTPNYTLNIIDNNITKQVYFKDKNSETIKVYEDILESTMNNYILNNVKDVLYNSKIHLKEQDIEYYVSEFDLKEEYNIREFEMSTLRSSDGEVARRIEEKLSEYYGDPYSNKFIDSMNEQGKYAKLYESMHFEGYKNNKWLIDAGTAIGVVSSLVSWPASTIMSIFNVYTTSTGVISIVNSFDTYECIGNVHWNKEVKVGSVYPYRAGKTIKGRVLLGDLDASYRKGRTNEHRDFDDNKSLMSTGIDNYINHN